MCTKYWEKKKHTRIFTLILDRFLLIQAKLWHMYCALSGHSQQGMSLQQGQEQELFVVTLMRYFFFC